VDWRRAYEVQCIRYVAERERVDRELYDSNYSRNRDPWYANSSARFAMACLYPFWRQSERLAYAGSLTECIMDVARRFAVIVDSRIDPSAKASLPVLRR
jgi:hypothetical protein